MSAKSFAITIVMGIVAISVIGLVDAAVTAQPRSRETYTLTEMMQSTGPLEYCHEATGAHP